MNELTFTVDVILFLCGWYGLSKSPDAGCAGCKTRKWSGVQR